MNLLLDTHVVLCMFGEPTRLGADAAAAIVDPRNTVGVSAATIWEASIKRAIGKLTVPSGLAAMCIDRDLEPVPITFEHAELAAALPRHHDDPFDRMLIAQAIHDGWQLVSADRRMRAYDVAVFDPAR